MNLGKFYVYLYLDRNMPGRWEVLAVDQKTGKVYPLYVFDYEPKYVGKGSGYRMNAHYYGRGGNDALDDHIRCKAIRPLIVIPFSNDDEYEAYYEESRIICAFDIYPNGPLLNKNYGRFPQNKVSRH